MSQYRKLKAEHELLEKAFYELRDEYEILLNDYKLYQKEFRSLLNKMDRIGITFLDNVFFKPGTPDEEINKALKEIAATNMANLFIYYLHRGLVDKDEKTN